MPFTGVDALTAAVDTVSIHRGWASVDLRPRRVANLPRRPSGHLAIADTTI
ncbi:MAG TPA: hypothetical protein VMZ73_01225 [Acidimicrobiales bacterium]|nr:hypothetical protein [Acidimicrobiales bacterium]